MILNYPTALKFVAKAWLNAVLLFCFLFSGLHYNLLSFSLLVSLCVMYFFLKNFNYTENGFITWLITFGVIIFILFYNLWLNYVVFEVTIIPILFIILKEGVNPYRIPAVIYIIIYSFIISLPRVVFLLINLKISSLTLKFKRLLISWASSFTLFLIFFIKSPVYLLHFWLPKAHTEASTRGSVILASYLLKIGRIGCLKVFFWRFWNIFKNLSYFCFSCIFILINCITCSDIKKLIAISSVFHIRVGLYLLFLNRSLRVKIFYFINVWHTFRRGGFFFITGCLCYFRSTRLIYLFSFLKYSVFFFCFILCIAISAGLPPFFSFVLEVLTVSFISFKTYLNLFLILRLLMGRIMYHLLLLNNIKLKFFIKKSLLITIKILFIFQVFFNYWVIF